MPSGFPVLSPAYGLGSYGRTGVALTISSPRTKLGSQGRIYAYYKSQGKGEQYTQYLINTMGLKYLPRVNPWTSI
jgi:hypothetical protein